MSKRRAWQVLVVVMVLALSFGIMTGCGNDKAEDVKDEVKEDLESTEQALEQRVQELEAEAEAAIEQAENVTEAKIHEAIDYIDQHIVDPAKDSEVTERLIYYGAYLKGLGEEAVDDANNVIVQLGEDVYTMAKNLYTKAETVGSEATTAVKEDIEEAFATIKAERDTLVADLHKFFHEAREELKGNQPEDETNQ